MVPLELIGAMCSPTVGGRGEKLLEFKNLFSKKSLCHIYYYGEVTETETYFLLPLRWKTNKKLLELENLFRKKCLYHLDYYRWSTFLDLRWLKLVSLTPKGGRQTKSCWNCVRKQVSAILNNNKSKSHYRSKRKQFFLQEIASFK